MGGYSNRGFVREQSAESRGGPILQGYLLLKENYNVLGGHLSPTKRILAVVSAPGSRNLPMTLARVVWPSH